MAKKKTIKKEEIVVEKPIEVKVELNDNEPKKEETKEEVIDEKIEDKVAEELPIKECKNNMTQRINSSIGFVWNGQEFD